MDNSLLVSRTETQAGREDEEPRFVMLETIREYASERLESRGEDEDIQRAHALFYLSLAEATQPETLARTQQEWWWTRLEEEHDNLRTALRWTLQNREVEIGTRFGPTLWRFWATRHPGEGRRYLEAVLALERTDNRRRIGGVEAGLPGRRRAYLLLVSGMLAARNGDYDQASAQYEESLALYRSVDYRKGTHGPLRELGVIAYLQGDYERAVLLNEQALAVAREFGSEFGSSLAVCNLADALRARGDLERSRNLLDESLASLRRGEQRMLVITNALVNTLNRLGSIQCALGEGVRAAESYGESLDLIWRSVGKAFEAVACLEGMARVAAIQDKPELAARLLCASATLRDEMGAPLSPIVQADHAFAANAAREALGEEVFQTAWSAGHAAPLDESFSDALAAF